ncbi:MAG: alpha/beta fold hydrolase [Janthinobacterium lividum]
MTQPFKHYQVATNGITLHMVETGVGQPVLFYHGFPDTWRTWRQQMVAVAAAGYRAIAVDIRSFGRSSAPAEASLYTPFPTVGDLVEVFAHRGLADVVLVGHDFGAFIAWNAALLRPDLFTAVFGISVPYMPYGESSFLDRLNAAGKTDFYMFDQLQPAADVAYTVAEFERTGFHGGLNHCQAIQLGFYLSGAFAGAVIRQPSFFLVDQADSVNELHRATTPELRQSLPSLMGYVELDGVGHWVQQEALAATNAALLGFLKQVSAQ